MFQSTLALFAAATLIGSNFATASALAAPPQDVAKRDDYAPAPTLPTFGSVWTIGGPAVITWNLTNVPSTATNIPWIDLYQSPSRFAEYVTTLATNVEVQAGQVEVITPDVEPGSYYIMGAWGQSSPHFNIVAA